MAALVQSVTGTITGVGGDNQTTAVSLPGSATLNNHIIVIVYNGTLRDTSSVSDAAGTTYTEAVQAQAPGAGESSIWYGVAGATNAGASVVVTLSGNSSDDCLVSVLEVSGLANPQTGLTQDFNTTSSGTTHTSDSITPANANGIVVAVAGRGNRNYTEDSDFTHLSTGVSYVYQGYILNAAATATTLQFTSDTATQATINIAAFVGASGGAGAVIRQGRMTLLGVGR